MCVKIFDMARFLCDMLKMKIRKNINNVVKQDIYFHLCHYFIIKTKLAKNINWFEN